MSVIMSDVSDSDFVRSRISLVNSKVHLLDALGKAPEVFSQAVHLTVLAFSGSIIVACMGYSDPRRSGGMYPVRRYWHDIAWNADEIVEPDTMCVEVR